MMPCGLERAQIDLLFPCRIRRWLVCRWTLCVNKDDKEKEMTINKAIVKILMAAESKSTVTFSYPQLEKILKAVKKW